MSAKYVYILMVKRWDSEGIIQGEVIYGVHTSEKSGSGHYESVVNDRRKLKCCERLTYGPTEGNYPAELAMPDKVLRQTIVHYTDLSDEQIRLVRWVTTTTRPKNRRTYGSSRSKKKVV